MPLMQFGKLTSNALLENPIKSTRLCIPSDTNRMIDDADVQTLNTLLKYAPNVPVVIVRTMKDKVLAMNKKEIREEYRRRTVQADNQMISRKRQSVGNRKIAAQAEEKLLERTKEDAEELLKKGFSASPLVYVSKCMYCISLNSCKCHS
jgi:hypothetical protein